MKLLLGVITIFLLISGYYWLYQRTFIYIPPKEKPSLHSFPNFGLTEITLHTKDGLSLYAWYKAPKNKKLTMVIFHGNGGSVAKSMPLATSLIKKGYGVLITTYRGYAGNPGTPTELGLYQDARAAMRFLNKHHHCYVIYGYSLGSGVATKMAEEFNSCGVILQSPYLSMIDMKNHFYPLLKFLTPIDKFSSKERINHFKVPLLIVHGKVDKIVPFKQGEALYQKYQGKKTLWAYEQLGHANLWNEAYFKRLLEYLSPLEKCCK